METRSDKTCADGCSHIAVKNTDGTSARQPRIRNRRQGFHRHESDNHVAVAMIRKQIPKDRKDVEVFEPSPVSIGYAKYGETRFFPGAASLASSASWIMLF